MSLYTAEGIILRNMDLGEADRIVSIYARDQGKVRAVAKGARRPRSRFVGSTQLFTYADFQIFRGTNLDNMSQVEIREPFSALREDLGLMVRASYMAELLDKMVEERDPDPAVFSLLLKCYHALAGSRRPGGADPDIVLRTYEARLMAQLGYSPVLDRCISCQGPLGTRSLAFYPSLGGIRCGECEEKEALPGVPQVRVSRGTIESLRWLLTHEPERLGQLRVQASSARELRDLLRSHIDFRLEGSLKSREFMEHTLEALEGGSVANGGHNYR